MIGHFFGDGPSAVVFLGGYSAEIDNYYYYYDRAGLYRSMILECSDPLYEY